jgi:glycosyltransferase involved in cell wall biosynthesis
VAPFYNERDLIEPFYRRLKETLETLQRAYEIVFVEDGSHDGSFQVMERLKAHDPTLRLIKLRWNFGQTAALAAGCEAARGDVIITMDGDLQYDPADIPRFLAKIEEGWDLVSGYRTDRSGDPLLARRLPSWVANRIMARLSGITLRDFGATFKAYRRDVIKNIPLYGEFHRFIPALTGSLKLSLTEIPIRQGVRSGGQSKYGLGRTTTVFFDLIRILFLGRYLTQPLRIFGGLGLIVGVAGGALFSALIYERYAHGLFILQEQGALFMVSIFLMLVGLQLLSLGLLAELMLHFFYQERQHKPYIIERQID